MHPYQAPHWLPGGHAQTIYPLLIKPAAPDYRRERWATPDRDFIDLDWVDGPAGSPLVVLFHGLEGSSRSHYAIALMHAVKARGWTGVVVHFRGCSGEPNLLPRAYHSGDSAEADWILRRLRSSHPQRHLHAAGVSLGGNVLLKWLGEQGSAASSVIDTAASVCAPLDLTASGHHLGKGFNRLYSYRFIRTLRRNAEYKLQMFPGCIDAAKLRAARSLYEFDNAVTAPLHGFRDTDDYWLRASSKPLLRGIAVPTLVINAHNDPFMPPSVLPQVQEVSRAVTLEQPAQGGHVGFVAGHLPGRLEWLPQRLLRHFGAVERYRVAR
jgi:predicted alpha/beta-fold hydrolase